MKKPTRPYFKKARKPRLLIIGCGDVMSRALPYLQKRFRIYIVKRTLPGPSTSLSAGTRLWGDLDQVSTLHRLTGLAQYIIYTAPPPSFGQQDTRVSKVIPRLVCSKKKKIACQPIQHIVYFSTSGVYGDCGGQVIDETRTPNPQNASAQRRVDAEKNWRAFAVRQAVKLTILRVPGIYAADRLPVIRLQNGMPILNKNEDTFSNHIHAEDLAYIASMALFRAPALRIYHASDYCPMLMGCYFTAVAEAMGLPLPIRLNREAVKEQVTPRMWEFIRESRRLANQRLQKELRIRLRYPTVQTFLQEYKRIAESL